MTAAADTPPSAAQSAPRGRRWWTQVFPVHVVRTMLGALFVVGSIGGFMVLFGGAEGGGEEGEMSIPLLHAMIESGYLFLLVKIVELVGAIMLLTNRFVPLALVLLAPVVVNIALFHFVLTPGHEIEVSIFLLAATAYLAWGYRSAWSGVLAAKTPIGSANDAPG